MKKTSAKDRLVAAPFLILVDGREKQPYQFHGIRGDARDGYHPFLIRWEWANLQTGDYSLYGYHDVIAIERKSLDDLYGTLGQNRTRFEAELERLSKLEFGAIVVEAPWRKILLSPPERSKLNPKVVYRTIISWSIKWGVPWFMMEDRRLAEVTVFRLLEKWWVKQKHEQKISVIRSFKS